MSTAATSLIVGTPIAVVACVVSYIYKMAWRNPPRTQRSAEFRRYWQTNPIFPQLGVYVRDDGWVYASPMRPHQRPLGRLAGATVSVGSTPITKVKPQLGWATIRFADGYVYRRGYATRNQAEALAQAAQFNNRATVTAPTGTFRRTRPASMGVTP